MSELYLGDAIAVLLWLAEQGRRIDSAVFSPPYWGKIDYHHPDQLGAESHPDLYLAKIGIVADCLYRLLPAGGQVLLNISDTWNGDSSRCGTGHNRKEKTFTRQDNRRKTLKGWHEKEQIGIPDAIVKAFQGRGFLIRSRYIWYKGPGADSKPGDRARQCHEDILHLAIPTPRKRRFQALYWDPTQLPESLINIPAISGDGHPCPWPPELAERLVLAITPPNGTTLDPFIGIGTTGLVAAEQGRKFIGIEINPDTFTKAVDKVGQQACVYRDLPEAAHEPQECCPA